MKQQDIGHFIGCKDNEYYRVVSTLKCILEQAKAEGRYGIYGESIEKLITELEENQGVNLSPWAMDFIITLLLDFVPEDMQNRY